MIRLAENPKRRAAVIGLAVLCLVSLLFAWRSSRPAPPRAIDTRDFPELFSEAAVCPRPRDPIANGRRSEELGLLRADRYPYSPRDGVLAVRRFLEAAACYRAAGATRDARRVERASVALSARVNIDYATARLSLLTALEKERWSDALDEIRQLLLLTQHKRRHEYVQWLEKNIGRVAARAGSAS